MNKYANLKNYNLFLRKFKKEFPCSFCGQDIKPTDYEKHCIAKKHDINVKVNCVWCQGKVSWMYGKKYLNIEHIKECSTTFLKQMYSFNNPSTFNNNILSITTTHTNHSVFKHKWKMDDLYQKCNAKDSFGVLEKILQQRPDIMVLNFDIDDAFIFKIPDPPTPTMMENVLKFKDENINKAVYFTKYFLGKVHELSDAQVASDYIDLDLVENWYHLMVRRVAFDSFLEAMRQYDFGHTRILPFYTWCDGGNFEDFEYRQHIHMIAASRKEGKHFFEHVWPKVTPTSKPPGCPRFLCKEHKRIITPLHFINTIQYVSRRESSCPGNFHQTMAAKKKKNNNNNNNNNNRRKKISFMTLEKLRHFYITAPLSEIAKFCQTLQYDKGIVDLLQNMYQNFEPDYDLDGVVQTDGRWHVPVKYLPHIPLDIPLYIHPDFVLNDNNNNNITNAYLSFPLNNIYFKTIRGKKTQPTEFKFLRPIENFNLPLRPKVQKRLNSIQISINRANRIKNEKIKALVESKNEEIKVLVESKNEEIQDLKMKNEALCKDLVSKSAEMKSSKKRSKTLYKNLLESKNAEIAALKKKITHIHKLHQQIMMDMEEKLIKSQQNRTSSPLEVRNDELTFLKKQLDKWKKFFHESTDDNDDKQQSKRHLSSRDDDNQPKMAKMINYNVSGGSKGYFKRMKIF